MERLIYTGPDFCAVEENGLLVEYIRQETVRQSGDILTGTVDRVMPGIGGAFVNIGRSRAGFLPLSENSLTFSSVPLQSGMRVTVQIRKEETGGKGAFLSRDLALPGSLVILMPCNRYIGVSNRIQDESVREKLRLLGQQIAGGRTGLVMREACMRAGHEEIRNEFTQLMDLWDSLSLQNHVRDTAGTVLFHSDPISQMLSEYRRKGDCRITETDKLPAVLEKQLRRSSERILRTGNGGNIVIDKCEAMTVIDVNTGSAVNAAGRNLLFLETNLSACETISAQIRLRDLSGIILIDFIDMDTEDDRNRVAARLNDLFDRDRRKTVIHGWTKLGLLEITRKRTGIR